jgi:hypothetical protein
MSKGIRQVTGLNNATRVAAVNSEDESTVIVRDEIGMVTVNVKGSTYPAGMTPEQARFVAKCLNDAADRVEAQSR